MKKVLLFAMFVLFNHLFAQNKPTSSTGQGALPDWIHRVENRTAYSNNTFNDPLMDFEQAAIPQKLKESSAIQHMDSIYHWQWDQINVKWKYFSKERDIVYNANALMIGYTTCKWVQEAWKAQMKDSLVYDANNHLILQIVSYWVEGRWQEGMRYEYTYDAHQNKTSYLIRLWNIDKWDAINQVRYTYDDQNRQISETLLQWQSDSWVNLRQTVNYYNDSNSDYVIVTQDWTGNSWHAIEKDWYSYNAQHQLIKILSQKPDGEDWEDYGQHLYSYDGNYNQVLLAHQWIEGSSITDNFKLAYTYDANNNLIYQSSKNWNGSEWTINTQGGNTYDANNFTLSTSYKRYDMAGTMTSSDSTYNYFHTGYSGIDEPLEHTISVFPNPGHGKFTIGCKDPLDAVEVYSMQGVRVYADLQINQAIHKEIDLSGCPKGIYMVKIRSGEKVDSRKIVVE